MRQKNMANEATTPLRGEELLSEVRAALEAVKSAPAAGANDEELRAWHEAYEAADVAIEAHHLAWLAALCAEVERLRYEMTAACMEVCQLGPELERLRAWQREAVAWMRGACCAEDESCDHMARLLAEAGEVQA